MELISSFAAFALASCAALLLIPEGALRRTASLAFGLMGSLLWLNGLLHIELPDFTMDPQPVFAVTGAAFSVSPALEAYERQLAASAGHAVQVPEYDASLIPNDAR